jgi:hypothetical protein
MRPRGICLIASTVALLGYSQALGPRMVLTNATNLGS